jgi:death-on-curing family protein
MNFADVSVQAHFDRTCGLIGDDDPYLTNSTLGIHEIIRAHYLIADFFIAEQRELGGVGPRDIGLLHSALHRPFIEFGGVKKWDDFFDKAATTLFGLIKDHPFHDANKRTALLSILYLLAKQGWTPRCSKVDCENLTVEIADMEIVKRARYKALTQAEEDPEIKYISHWLRKNTRAIDRREYAITYRDLRRILDRYDYVLENPRDNMIDVVKVERRTGLVAFIAGTERRYRVGRLGYPSENKQVSKDDLRAVRKKCNLTHKHGIDSQTFYFGVDDMTSLLAEYQDNIRRLAER